MLKPFTTLFALIRKSALLQPLLLAGKTYLFLHLHHDQPASKLCPALWCHCRKRSSFQQLPFFHPFLSLPCQCFISLPLLTSSAGFTGSLAGEITIVFTSRLLNRGHPQRERVGAFRPPRSRLPTPVPAPMALASPEVLGTYP